MFNVDRAQAATSLCRLADLDATVACFGHGEPLTHDAAAELQAAAQRLPADTGQNPSTRPGTCADPSDPLPQAKFAAAA